MKRGAIVAVAAPGDYGKPRPALVIQSDFFKDTGSVLLCLFTGERVDAPLIRLDVKPSARNGLKKESQIMADKIIAYPRSKCGKVIGYLESDTMAALNRILSVLLGLAD